MNLQINRTAFLDVEKISSIKSHIEKLKYEQDAQKLKCIMDIDMTYRDIDFNECFKSVPYEFELDIASNLEIEDVKINKLYIYVIEALGINIEYELELSCIQLEENDAKEIELIPLASNSEQIIAESDDNIKTEEEINQEIKENQTIASEESKKEIEKVKEEISKDYEAKLASNLASRDNVKIVSTVDKKSDIDFIKLFNSNEAKFKIKTLLCDSEEELNEISKKYKISINDLLKGYDRESKRVIFKYTKPITD